VLGRADLEAVGSLIPRIPGSAKPALHPGSCSRRAKRGLAQFGNPCTASAKGQLAFPWGISCLEEILLVFFWLYHRWARGRCVWLRQPLPTEPLRAHTPVCCLRVPPRSEVCVQLAWKSFPRLCLKAGSGTSAPAWARSSNLLGLLPLLSFQSGCFADGEMLKEPTVLPAGSAAWLPTTFPGVFVLEPGEGCRLSRTMAALRGRWCAIPS